MRYRILTSRMNKKEFGNVASSIAADSRLSGRYGGPQVGPGLIGLVLAIFETPRKVLECDGEDELPEVRRMLRQHRMGVHDLVDPGGGWREARDFEPLSDLCAEIEQRERSRRLKVCGALAMLVAAAAVGLYLAW